MTNSKNDNLRWYRTKLKSFKIKMPCLNNQNNKNRNLSKNKISKHFKKNPYKINQTHLT
jgi:hypothetical protein